MTVSYRRWMHFGAAAMILVAALIPAFGLPYLFGAPFAIGAVALILGGDELLGQRAERGLRALGSRAGSAVREHKEAEHSDAWLRERGFAEPSVWVVRAKSVDAAGATASIVEICPSPAGRPRSRVGVISAPSRVAGTLCLRALTSAGKWRAQLAGGRAGTGTGLDEHFLVYSDDAAAAKVAAGALDAGAIGALFQRVRALCGTDEIRFAVTPERASVMVHGAPAELFAPDAMRDVVQALAATGRGEVAQKPGL